MCRISDVFLVFQGDFPNVNTSQIESLSGSGELHIKGLLSRYNTVCIVVVVEI